MKNMAIVSEGLVEELGAVGGQGWDSSLRQLSGAAWDSRSQRQACRPDK